MLKTVHIVKIDLCHTHLYLYVYKWGITHISPALTVECDNPVFNIYTTDYNSQTGQLLRYLTHVYGNNTISLATS